MRLSAPTPHISAQNGEVAETVLMPGDPLRARFIAETFFDNPVEFNSVRGMLGYTGTYKGKRISAMGSGIGMPSMGLYSYELFNFYGVERIIRVGTAGGMHPDAKLYDVVMGMGACFNNHYDKQYQLGATYTPICSYALLEQAVKVAREKEIPVKVGNIASMDLFYAEHSDLEQLARLGVLAVEMEAAALYMNAAWAGKQALCILTISDTIFGGEVTTPEERQTAFTQMMEIAVELA
ncbi:MAG: purine-nucleoside phosphorylase [Oscillospiraceae bacterium]|nr:purine-nucleoside phosphorylase [Oscillospiraceae bacterium]